MRCAVGWLLLYCAGLLPAAADLPATWPGVGERLASGVLGPGLSVSVYGPAVVRPEEAATLTVVLEADASSSILSGVVQLSCAPETAGLMGVPMPAGSYVGMGEWSADLTGAQAVLPPAEMWRPLLPLAPELEWVLRVPPLVQPGFKGTAGQIFDLLQTWPAHAQPPAALRQDPTDPEGSQGASSRRQQRALVFALGEDLAGALQTTPRASVSPQPRGGQMLRLVFSFLPRSVAGDLSLWLCVQAPGQSVVHELPIPLRPPAGPPRTTATVFTTPQLLSPEPNALVDAAVRISGKAYPGALVVAWLQVPASAQNAAPVAFSPIRQLADMDGAFAFSLPVPPQAAPACELRIRAEAPGYRSPEVACPLRVGAVQ
jgi:hypothetical protein